MRGREFSVGVLRLDRGGGVGLRGFRKGVCVVAFASCAFFSLFKARFSFSGWGRGFASGLVYQFS